MSDFSIWGLGLAIVLLACVHLEQALAWRRIRKLQETARFKPRAGRDRTSADTQNPGVPPGRNARKELADG